MLYVIKCVDKADHLQVRLDNRAAHVEYLKSYGEKLFAAGPTLTEEDEAMNGSVVILDLENKAEAQEFCDNDPYAKAGLFDSVTISKWKKVLPA
ncbi:YCII-related [Candidatus Terasakiella magnetica]|uniref:YCII-related n=1 Tax=Candidatus Terasakiella magnetica TaxID=1867952 RepID=A0A1C3RFZ6_9PROT|nr:YciI family protein [Candidatus Terasakiella magnetica]SCA56185.1 YCII-related [Candidatus Terasakiella magnetica]